MKALPLALLALLLAAPASATHRVEVVGETSAGDQVGALLIDSVRARVGRSSGMFLDSSGDRFVIEVATLDPDASTTNGLRTAWGVTFVQVEGGTWRYLAHSVGVCGVTRVEQVALGIVSDLAKLVSVLTAHASSTAPPAPALNPGKWRTLPDKWATPQGRAILLAIKGLTDVRTALRGEHPDFATVCARAREVAASVSSLATPPGPERQRAVDYANRGAEACGPASKVTTLIQFALAKEQLQALVER